MPDVSESAASSIAAARAGNPSVADPGGGGGDADASAEDGAPEEGTRPTPLPAVDSTTTRATVAWWFVFIGPVALAAALLVAGSVAGRDSALWVFTLGVWAFTLTLGLAAAPRDRALWWVVPLAVSFVAAGVALSLLFMLDAAADRMATTRNTSSAPPMRG